ncbi:unnamed protein product [Chrysodeixis includens]|uniref:Uncharacterized protein n=1 Tax=Chrysodeixis includens TaxID=689277 RepID=A0A9P0BSF7_CHRIL|nr:unnamed protein product [Chrysodeixis includens]
MIPNNAGTDYIVHSCTCWRFFQTLVDYTFKESIPFVANAQNEFIYGNCTVKKKKFYTHVHLDRMEVIGKIILRGWLNIERMPSCIVLRGSSIDNDPVDIARGTAHSFQFCIPRVTFCHSQRRWRYFYYEWFVPYDLASNMDWDIYLYGPYGSEWL